MDFSIIVCTYKPDPLPLFRVLKAISQLTIPDGSMVELVLVDNCSPEPVSELIKFGIPDFNHPFNFRVVEEKQPGLLHARKKGYQVTSGEIIVFFDDDNEPDPDYLLETNRLYQNFPNIGVAGPGTISVEYLGSVESWLVYYKGYFQERKSTILQYACVPEWLGFYPPGTGQTVRRSVYNNYLEKVSEGTYSSIGRTKTSMASAEDVQLVFCSILMQMAVASVPGMKLRHLISARKTTIPSLKRLLFGMSSSYPEAYCECFPAMRQVIPFYSNTQIFQLLWKSFISKILYKRSPKAFLFDVSEIMGKIYGSNLARGGNTNSFWFSLISVLKLR